mmetsp:Transcript_32805/g.70293  ORF Transcript_32805/g.70293 Transcript_32805/m.70293 type:complete len:86 (+) Transcript_32805:258-515(+)
MLHQFTLRHLLCTQCWRQGAGPRQRWWAWIIAWCNGNLGSVKQMRGRMTHSLAETLLQRLYGTASVGGRVHCCLLSVVLLIAVGW